MCHGTTGIAAECKCFLPKSGEESAGPSERGCPDSSLYCTSWCRRYGGPEMWYGKCNEDICVCVPRGSPIMNELTET